MQEIDASDMSQGELAYARLYGAIEAGDLKPGDRIRETEVADRFSLSRTPVREAIRRLEADGIVEHKARMGAVIRTLSHSEVVELYEMRIVLERTAAELAAQHAATAEIEELKELNSAIAVSADPADAAKINQHFHRCIYLASRNRFLLEAARSLHNALLLLGPTTLDGDTRISDVVRQHEVIVEAIEARDETGAGVAAEVHLQTSLRHRLRSLRS